jgi:carbonic anhydrase/acetyltransferase-like protein (isoleucine patch superfamily)
MEAENASMNPIGLEPADASEPLASVSIHQHALVEPGARIGPGARVWAFAHILAGAVGERDCNICDHTFIENDVVVGDRVTIKGGAQLWDGVTLGGDWPRRSIRRRWLCRSDRILTRRWWRQSLRRSRKRIVDL